MMRIIPLLVAWHDGLISDEEFLAEISFAVRRWVQQNRTGKPQIAA